MSRLRRMSILAGSTLSAVVVAAAVTVPAQAASSPGWRLVFSHHYGPAANFSDFSAVVAPGQADAWAFGGTTSGGEGGSPAAARWNGRNWRPAALPAGLSSVLGAASASSPGNIWAVSSLGQYVLRWNGAKWSVAKRFKGTGELTGVTALSRTNVWVFGGGGFIGGLGTWHYNGHSWTKFGGAASGIDRASALAAGNIWAVGSSGDSPQDALVHYNGTRWTRLSAPALKKAQFNDVAAVSRTDVWAVGAATGGQPPSLVVHWNGQRWVKATMPWKLEPRRIVSDGRGGIWIAADAFPPGEASWMVHRSLAGKWTRTRIGSSDIAILGLARIPGTTSMWGAGGGPATTSSDAAVYADGRVGP